ncbi:hypothetical protein BD311DRAFT_244193 [Dichomitus squalens]|uniref:Uncharacterized protein n=1 Tax=Dichomitus squalens TaxID=114155 RepID=A0A4Q9M5N3_9APHY|nr:hypothetical protein BD311DRAFT_244193 [Dichomitus squalens]
MRVFLSSPSAVVRMLHLCHETRCRLRLACISPPSGAPAGKKWSTTSDDHKRRALNANIVYIGTIYFLILAVLSSLHLAFTLLSISVDALKSVSVVTAFTTPLSAILVSHFLLHLQSASLRAVGSIPSSQISSLHLDRSLVFERVVGSLGASISVEDHLEDDCGDDENEERADEPTQTSRE